MLRSKTTSFLLILMAIVGLPLQEAQGQRMGSLPWEKECTVSPEVLQSEHPKFDLMKSGTNTISCNGMIEDHYGFLWIGGEHGLTRYNGSQMRDIAKTNFEENDSPMSIYTMMEDSLEDYIWCSLLNTEELLCVSQKNLKCRLMQYEIPKEIRVQNHMPFSALMNWNDTTLIACTKQTPHLLFVDKRTGAITYKKVNITRPSSGSNRFLNINGQHYLHWGGIIFLIKEDRSQKTLSDQIELEDIGIGSVTLSKNYKDKIFALRINMEVKCQELISFDLNTKETKLLFSDTKISIIKDLCPTEDGIWETIRTGLLFFRYSDSTIVEYNTSSYSVPNNNLTFIDKLRNQPIFFIGSRDGLIKMNYLASKFHSVDLRMHSRYRNSEPLFVLKDSRLGYWVWTSRQYMHRSKDETLFSPVKIFDFEKQGPSGIAEYKEKDGIVVTLPQSVMETDYEGRKTKEVFINCDPKDRISVSFVLPDHKMILMMGSGYYKLDMRTGKYHKFAPKIKTSIITSYDLHDGHIWLVNVHSTLFSVNCETGEITEHGDIKATRINSIRHTRDGNIDEIWASTNSGGLYYYVPSLHETKPLARNKYTRTTMSIERDSDDNIWVGSEYGILYIHEGQTYEFSNTNYDICKSLSRRNARIDNDCLIMLGSNGFVEFNTRNFAHSNVMRAPILESYELANSVSNTYDNFTYDDIPNTNGQVEVPAGIRTVSLNICTMNYDQTREIHSQWRLEGDTAWHMCDKNNCMMLSNLEEGEHTVLLRNVELGREPSDNAETTSIKIQKRVFFFETRWFHAILISLSLSMLGAGIWFYNTRNRRKQIQLEQEVAKQAGLIMEANRELRHSESVIRKQYAALSEAKENLEEKVAERTRDLEIAKKKAEESNELKSTFLASLGHEVRTPMNAIMGFAKLLEMPECPEEERVEFAHLIIESSNGMLSLIGGLLDTSRIERGVLTLSKSQIDIHSELHDVWRILSMEKRNPQVEFLLDHGDELENTTLYADKDRLRQIIINLTYNAFKFTDKGYVKIKANVITADKLSEHSYPVGQERPSNPNERLFFCCVSDSGIGMPADKLEVIFEPFRRLTNNKLKYGGMGLGLNIVKRVTELMGGNVWVTSKEGVGSKFYFYIPMQSSDTNKENTDSK